MENVYLVVFVLFVLTVVSVGIFKICKIYKHVNRFYKLYKYFSERDTTFTVRSKTLEGAERPPINGGCPKEEELANIQ